MPMNGRIMVMVLLTLAMASGCQSRWEKIRDFQPKVGMTPEQVEAQLGVADHKVFAKEGVTSQVETLKFSPCLVKQGQPCYRLILYFESGKLKSWGRIAGEGDPPY
jgi:hypothetical protein